MKTKFIVLRELDLELPIEKRRFFSTLNDFENAFQEEFYECYIKFGFEINLIKQEIYKIYDIENTLKVGDNIVIDNGYCSHYTVDDKYFYPDENLMEILLITL